MGYQQDGDSGLKLLGHRYYDPSTGRFVTRDPSKDGRNWYAYCSSDPTFGYDPTGLISWWKVISGAIGIVTIVPIVLGTINAMRGGRLHTVYSDS